jgi:chromosome transmission fidelity protein 18
MYDTSRDLDALATYESAGAYLLAMQAPTRYAVRQVLDQELQKTIAQKENASRQARLRAGRGGVAVTHEDDDKENLPLHLRPAAAAALSRAEDKAGNVKRDFFGRVIVERPLGEMDGNAGGRKVRKRRGSGGGGEGSKVWVTYHEGLNNAVRKPLSLEEFLRGF